MEVKNETASQLFARLSAPLPDYLLHDNLFSILPDGVKLGDLIEICGEEGSGKTEMLYSILAYCLLPQTMLEEDWSQCSNNALAVYIDTDYKFSVLRLTKVLEARVRSLMSCWAQTRKGQSVSGEHPETSGYVRCALSRLLVYKASSSDALNVVLQNLNEFLAHHRDISLLMIDSISAFYAMDRIFGVSRRQQETKQRRNVELISNLMTNNHLVVIATKSLLYSSKKHHLERGDRSMLYQSHHDFMSQEWQAKVKYRILIQRKVDGQIKMKSIDPTVRSVCLIKPTNIMTRSLNFTLTEDGIAT